VHFLAIGSGAEHIARGTSRNPTLRFSWSMCVMRLLQTKEEFNNEMQSLTSKLNQDIEEVKECMSALQVCCCAFSVFRADNLISGESFYCAKTDNLTFC